MQVFSVQLRLSRHIAHVLYHYEVSECNSPVCVCVCVSVCVCVCVLRFAEIRGEFS